MSASKWYKDEDIQMFLEYLRIPSIVSDSYDYANCITYIKMVAAQIGLPVKTYYPGGRTKPIAIIEWKGTEPEQPKIVLCSHMDVVWAEPIKWTHPPFGAIIDFMGRIVARGTQDMKCNGMQYLSAIRALKRQKVHLKRTVLVMFVPDGENGGKNGMELFVPTDEFKALNIGFAIDHGEVSSSKEYKVFFGDRATWQLQFKIKGNPGHSAALVADTAAAKVKILIDKFMDYRALENKRLKYHYTKLQEGDVNSVNLTSIKGGCQNNVIPGEITLCFDCCLSVKTNHTEFEEMINQWITEAGEGIELTYHQQDPAIKPTVLDENLFWGAFQNAAAELKIQTKTQICPYSTDCRFMRKLGIPAIGFTAINYTPLLSHMHNEFICASTYLDGIEIWKKIIFNVGNV